ncbi:hypothetical protein AP071_14970 [Rhodobacter capsulatus]|nr:hypothetical protein AP071_14970 [Rhodobacter capsulatus]KQB16884.1 hypothetical protein AP073_09680 [Rhodobacter capsulatus]
MMRRDEPRFLRLRDGLAVSHHPSLSFPAYAAILAATLLFGHLGLRTALNLTLALEPHICHPALAAAPLYPECR